MEQKKKTDHEWLKTLLVSIIGTFVGVSLTFFADRMVERRQQKKAQRETAIMAVCDIDEIIQKLKEEKQMEEADGRQPLPCGFLCLNASGED